MTDRTLLHHNGYALLHQAVPLEWLAPLRAVFDASVRPAQHWPTPRGQDWRHALLDDDATVLAVCRLPALLATVGELIGEPFFIAQAEGREPLPGGGHQSLHRDLSAQRPGDMANAIVYLDDYGPANGATRLIPGSHRAPTEQTGPDFNDESRVLPLAGAAGDILVFDVDLIHAASLNVSGARRRSILIGYAAHVLHEVLTETAPLRLVRMDMSERFEPQRLLQQG